ncbi:MAG: hypothetical protein JWN98_2263 [Abditibacteriota bacterium]|nr:hypothetical protein [Abditibacteriota bacterium]
MLHDEASAVERPPLGLLLSVALLSASVLAFEVALTRVFSVVLRYHFAFLVISIAVCGLGVGGYAAHWLRARKPLSLPLLAAVFAIAIDVVLFAMLRGVFATTPEAYWLAAVLVLIPFGFAGAFLAEAFARFPSWSGRVYAWDLAGAAVAAVAVVGLLQIMSAPAACVFAATVGSLPALLLVSGRSPRSLRWLMVVPLLLFLVWVAGPRFKWFEIPPLPPKIDADGLSLADRGVTQPLFTELGTPGNRSRVIETRWNAFARTDVVQDPTSPNSYLLYTNGNVPTNMMNWDGSMAAIAPIARDFPLSDWCFAVAPLKKADSKVLAIGPGGGLDALLALGHGAKRFDGAEINPSIVQIMRDYKRYNGGIYERPEVNVQTADGRAFVREQGARGQRYDLLFSALTKTATAGQGMALLESFIYTEDAFADYWDVLSDNGQIAMVLDNPILLARFSATALKVMASRGIETKDAMRHLAIAHFGEPGPYQFAFVLQKSPFTRAQTFNLETAGLQRRLTTVWIPHQAALSRFGPYPEMADGRKSLDDFIAFFRDLPEQPLDVSPCPDDRPFVLDLSFQTLPVFKQLAVLAVVLALSLSLFGLYGARQSTLNGAPATSLSASDALWVLYFLALGVGFMLVELPLAQKLILPLGYPTLALTVILFSVLLGGGAGSWFSQRFDEKKLARVAMLCALGVAIATMLLSSVIDSLKTTMPLMSLPARCLLAATLLLPLGFLLGVPFPSGMRLFAQRRASSLPLVWGLNGVASVVGSLCAAMFAKAWGFSQVLALGAFIYLMAALILWFQSCQAAPKIVAEASTEA